MITTDIRIDILNFFNSIGSFPCREMPNVREMRSCREVVALSRSHNSRETIIVAKFLFSLFGGLASGQSFPTRCSLPHHARVIQVRKLTLALVWPCAHAPIRSQPPTLLKYYALTRIFFIHNLSTIFSFVLGTFHSRERKIPRTHFKVNANRKTEKQVFPN